MITIPSGIFQAYRDGIDAAIIYLGKPCILVYEPKFLSCPNCITNTFGSMSSSVYRAGGPIPFTDGQVCPYCNGAGTVNEPQTENITLNIYWNSTDWIKTGITIDAPDGIIQTRGFIVDWPKLMRCVELRVHKDIGGFELARFTRIRPLYPQGLGQDAYVIGYWKRVS